MTNSLWLVLSRDSKSPWHILFRTLSHLSASIIHPHGWLLLHGYNQLLAPLRAHPYRPRLCIIHLAYFHSFAELGRDADHPKNMFKHTLNNSAKIWKLLPALGRLAQVSKLFTRNTLWRALSNVKVLNRRTFYMLFLISRTTWTTEAHRIHTAALCHLPSSSSSYKAFPSAILPFPPKEPAINGLMSWNKQISWHRPTELYW